jgi:hypothetical protein
MKNIDYYTVMESRIKYYARKYDPYDHYRVKDMSPDIPEIPQARRTIGQRISSGFGYIFSILF